MNTNRLGYGLIHFHRELHLSLTVIESFQIRLAFDLVFIRLGQIELEHEEGCLIAFLIPEGKGTRVHSVCRIHRIGRSLTLDLDPSLVTARLFFVRTFSRRDLSFVVDFRIPSKQLRQTNHDTWLSVAQTHSRLFHVVLG